MYDYQCPNHRFEAYMPRYVETTLCRARGCEQLAHVVFVATRGYSREFTSDPVVIHRAADGSVRFPGSANAPVPEGFERVELSTTHEKRRFEREINIAEHKRWEESQERKEAFFGEMRRANRSDLRAAMRHMTPLQRDACEAIMRGRDNRPRQKYEAGFHIEALSMDASNRSHCDDPINRGRK